MKFLHTDIGSAKDNFSVPVHNWYKFTAGFSHKLVDELIKQKIDPASKAVIFDPFAGCGTTLVSAQKHGIRAVGNEAQNFMYDVIRAKLNWKIDKDLVEEHLVKLRRYISLNWNKYDLEKKAHSLLQSLYQPSSLKTLYLIKSYLPKIKSTSHRLFFKLALSQTLHKVSIHPIAVPYIVRSKTLSVNQSAWKIFLKTIRKMTLDVLSLKSIKKTSRIHLNDSRFPNKKIRANSCSICITSPPYLNNLDYGEVSKVHTHFFGITDNWNDITKKVRKKLVTGSTTHYVDADFRLSDFKKSSFYKNNKKVADSLIKRYEIIKKISSSRTGKKSFHILMLLYFQDMYKVLTEIRRVLKPNAKAYLVIGDSAPYGVFIKTTNILAKIANNSGFEKSRIIKIRSRGTKWKDLRFRHNQELSENLLILS